MMFFEIQKSGNYDNIESHDVVWNKCLTRVDTLKQENAADRVIRINRGRFNKQVRLAWKTFRMDQNLSHVPRTTI